MLRTAKWLSDHKIILLAGRLYPQHFDKDRSGLYATIVRTLLLSSTLFFPFIASAQTGSCTTAVCKANTTSQADFLAALPAPNNTNSTVVVNVPSGTSAWTSTISYTVPTAVTNLTIQGQTTVSCTGTAGTSSYSCTPTDETILADSVANTKAMLQFTINGTSTVFRLSGITLQGGSGAGNKTNGMVTLGGSSQNFRVDHCDFNGSTYSFTPISLINFYGSLEGVIDHSYFNLGASGSFMNGMHTYNTTRYDSTGWGDGSWAAPTNFGSSHAIFAENNEFMGGYNNDCNQGSRYVSRYNTTLNPGAGVQAHPTYSGGGRNRGCRSLEVYHNYYGGSSVVSYADPYGMRGGTGLFWDNTIGAGYGYVLAVYTDRATSNHDESASPTSSPEGWGYCGTSPLIVNNFPPYLGSAWDGNISTSTGYPCLDGVGRGQTVQPLNGADWKPYTSTGPLNSVTGTVAWPQQYLEPLYMWGTTNNSGRSLLSIQDPVTQQNRDVYVDNPACAGGCSSLTTGTGYGPLASRPTTCTAGPGGTYYTSPTGSYGVGYFATDTQTLYVCTATNTWTAIYTPYTYPHPLTSGSGVSGSAPNPPTGLVVTVH